MCIQCWCVGIALLAEDTYLECTVNPLDYIYVVATLFTILLEMFDHGKYSVAKRK